jgi:hypothetical protein
MMGVLSGASHRLLCALASDLLVKSGDLFYPPEISVIPWPDLGIPESAKLLKEGAESHSLDHPVERDSVSPLPFVNCVLQVKGQYWLLLYQELSPCQPCQAPQREDLTS